MGIGLARSIQVGKVAVSNSGIQDFRIKKVRVVGRISFKALGNV